MSVIPALWEAETGRSLEFRSLRYSLVNMAKPSLYEKYKKLAVIPATQEAEAGELPEPRRWRLQ